MSINDYLKENGKISYYYLDNIEKYINFYGSLENFKNELIIRRPRVICNDGYSISVHACDGAYCEPRVTLYPSNWGEGYSKVELGFPSESDELINYYAEQDPRYDETDKEYFYQNTVYPYVPVEIVDKLIEKHGGIAGYVD